MFLVKLSSSSTVSLTIQPSSFISPNIVSSTNQIAGISLTENIVKQMTTKTSNTFSQSLNILTSSSFTSFLDPSTFLSPSPVASPIVLDSFIKVEVIAGVTTGGIIALLTIASIIVCVTTLVCVLRSPQKKNSIKNSVPFGSNNDIISTMETNPFYGCSTVLIDHDDTMQNNPSYGQAIGGCYNEFTTIINDDDTMESNPTYGQAIPMTDSNDGPYLSTNEHIISLENYSIDTNPSYGSSVDSSQNVENNKVVVISKEADYNVVD